MQADGRVDLSAITQVVAESCGCNCPDESTLMGLATDPASLFVSLTVMLPFAGVYEVCAGEVVVARLLATETCMFEDSSTSPCLACGTAREMESEACQQLALEYCASSPQDKGCDYLTVRFERPLGRRAEVRLVASLPTSVSYVSDAQQCGGEVSANLGDTVFQMVGETLVVSFHAFATGSTKLCAHYEDGPKHLATILITPGACLFAHPGLCQCDFTKDETCVVAAAEYCSANPSDRGCEMLLPVFERDLGMAAISLPGSMPMRIQACECAADCTPLSAKLTAASGFVRLDFSTAVPGKYNICDEGTTKAVVRVSGSCSTAVPHGMCAGLPCDPADTACNLLFSDACATYDDEACDYLKYHFTRPAFEKTSLAFHVPGLTDDIRFAAASCGGCGTADCGAPEIGMLKLRTNVAVNELYVEFHANKTGEVQLCMGNDILAHVTLQKVCVFDLHADSPCAMEACAAEETSFECVEYAVQYCAKYPTDGGCALFRPVYELPADELATLSVAMPAGLSLSAWECGDNASQTVNASQSVILRETVDGGLVTLLMKSPSTEVKLCHEETWLASVKFVAEACQFSNPDICVACAGDVATCNAAVAEHCTTHDDEGCDLLSFVFARRALEVGNITFHTKLTEVDISFTAMRCTCDEPCAEPSMSLVDTRLGEGVLTIDFLPAMLGTFRVCSDGIQLATVNVESPAPCLFSGEGAPCADNICADPRSESCQAAAARYCADSDDSACSMFAPVYSRTVGGIYQFGVMNGATKMVEGCSCSDDCTTTSATLGRVDPVGEFSLVTIATHAKGEVKICVDGQTAVTVHLVESDCNFDSFPNPCTASACMLEPASETCQLLMAEYCVTYPEDTACAILQPFFVRSVGEWSSLEMNVLSPGDVFVTREECSCSSPCGGSTVLLGSIEYTVKTLRLQIYPYVAANYILCADEAVASFQTVIPQGCGADPALCLASCEDPSSEMCQATLAEQCGSSTEGVCAFLSPVFVREAGPVVNVPVQVSHLGATSCAHAAPEMLAALPDGMATDLYLGPVGTNMFLLCKDDVQVGRLELTVPGCPFDVSSAPCTASICQTPYSETCQLLTAKYCADSDDASCALVAPFFRRNVSVVSALPGVSAGDATTALREGCSCSSPCSAPEFRVIASEPVQVSAAVPGTFGICAEGSLMASIAFETDPLACTLEYEAGQVVCAICGTDPESEGCALAGAEYCSRYPLDQACAFFVPYYERTQGQVEVSIYSKLEASTTRVTRTTCAEAEQDADVVDNAVVTTVRFAAQHEGIWSVCADGVVVARVGIDGARCLIGGFASTSAPCMAHACSDPLS
jgi:hypothetical protein